MNQHLKDEDQLPHSGLGSGCYYGWAHGGGHGNGDGAGTGDGRVFRLSNTCADGDCDGDGGGTGDTDGESPKGYGTLASTMSADLLDLWILWSVEQELSG